VVDCRLCHGRARRVFGLGPYEIMRCRACGFGWPEPMPTEAELQALYAECHHQHAKLDDKANTVQRQRVASRIRDLMPREGSLLDIGCGFGHSLDAVREVGFETYGVERDPRRAAITASKGHSVEEGVLDSRTFPGRKFDVVLLNHVIEHLIDPAAMVHAIRDVLVDGGILFVGCPNFQSPRARLTGPHYGHVCPPEHISYFGERALRLLMRQAGFEEVRVDRFTHTLHAKDLLAYYMYFRFRRPRKYESPFEKRHEVTRFTDGRGRALKRAVYGGIMAVSHALRPFLNALGGDQIESYWRKV